MRVLFWRGWAAEATHDAAVCLNDVVVTDVVGLWATQGAAQAVKATEQYAWVDGLEAFIV